LISGTAAAAADRYCPITLGTWGSAGYPGGDLMERDAVARLPQVRRAGSQLLARRWSRVILRELGAGWASGPRLVGLAEQIAAASLWSSLPWLSRLTQQSLVITGTADSLVPAPNASILASTLPRAQIYRVHGGGHMCLLDCAAQVGPVIAAFLRSLEPAAVNEAGQLS
jgi:pimeloyl-ACP methyl ester carboxylesterase